MLELVLQYRECRHVSLNPAVFQHVVVVDDHAIAREGLALLVQRRWPGTEVSQAADLTHLNAVLAARPDVSLVVLDLHLGQSNDHLAGLRALRKSHPLLPVAMISADSDALLAREALQLGAAGFLSKSADAQVLTEALQLVLDGGCYLPPFLQKQQPAAAGESLTPRQREVLQCLIRGQANKEIARALDLAEPTVKAHLVTIFRVLKVKSRTQAVMAGRNYLGQHAIN
jgi:DNA-binding NarL/FixJ family response regulator